MNPNANSYIQFNDVQGPYNPNRYYVNSKQANFTRHPNQHSNRQYHNRYNDSNRFNETQSNSYSQHRRQAYQNRNNNFVNYQQLYPNYQHQQHNNPQHLQQLVSNSSPQLQQYQPSNNLPIGPQISGTNQGEAGVSKQQPHMPYCQEPLIRQSNHNTCKYQHLII